MVDVVTCVIRTDASWSVFDTFQSMLEGEH